MFFYTPKENKQHFIVRRATQHQLGQGGERTLGAQLAEALVRPSQEAAGPSIRQSIIDLRRRSRPISEELADELLALQFEQQRHRLSMNLELNENNNVPHLFHSYHTEDTSSPVDSIYSFADARRHSRGQSRSVHLLRRPTITIQEDGRVYIGKGQLHYLGHNLFHILYFLRDVPCCFRSCHISLGRGLSWPRRASGQWWLSHCDNRDIQRWRPR